MKSGIATMSNLSPGRECRSSSRKIAVRSAGFEGVSGEVRVAEGKDDAQRHAVDVERLGLFEGSMMKATR